MAHSEFSTRQGGCTCGQVRYQMNDTPLFVHCCHCSYCQQQSGSAFAINAMIEAGNVTLLQGEPEIIDTPSPSGRGQKISRCPNCKVAVWSNYGGAGDAIHFIRVGTLDDPNSCPPDIHIYTSTRQDWVDLPQGANVVDEYYKRSDYWPAESIARVKALKGGVPARA